MFMLNGQPLSPDTPFTVDGIQYPANWLRLASLDEKTAIGIMEVADPERYDDRFYWGVGNPKDLEQVRSTITAQIKTTAFSLLQPTDYVDLRNVRDPSYKPEVMTAREAIRTACTTNLAAIAAAATVDEIAVLQFTWPQGD
jgi:hypothetical protein